MLDMPTNCTQPGCDKLARARGLCMSHYGKARYAGEINTHRTGKWQDRFWAKVQKSDDCWLWTAATSNGYGVMGGTNVPEWYAHRLSWLLATGEPAGDSVVCHVCDVRTCVRPDHLFLGTIAVNQTDMSIKKRSTWGERSYHAKLTEADVRRIRKLYDAGMKTGAIAALFPVSRHSITNITKGRTWGQFTD